MSRKPIFLVFVLALLVVGIAAAKTYNFTLVAPATAGTFELKSGDYLVSLDQTTAVLRKSEGGKSMRVPVKVEAGDKKFDTTEVEISTKDGKNMIASINLGGSKTRLLLGK